MVDLWERYFSSLGLQDTSASWAGLAAAIGILLIISVILFVLARQVIVRLLTLYIRNNRFGWDNKILEKRVFHRLCHLVPPLVFYTGASGLGLHASLVQRLASVYMILVIILVVDALLNAADAIYSSHDISRRKPIKGYLQGLKVFLFVIGGIVVISRIIDQSPIILLSGIGAMTAVILLIFQDSILGFVAGIQLASNDMIRIGDWIEMPKYNADGDVIDISLTTVKIANFDRTITTIPTHALVKDSFRNWRGMIESGGRRIKRSIFIDTSSISFCTDEMLERFRSIHYLKDYINQRQGEIDSYNAENQVDLREPVNGRHMTNIGTFRAYVMQYLNNHPRIHKSMTIMVRQLPPGEHGLPIEIYAFANTTDWGIYETIQADIFDHILAVVPRFGLRLFQEPSGYDMQVWRQDTHH